MHSEEDIKREWAELCHHGELTPEVVAQAERLLAELRPESPLLIRLRGELDELLHPAEPPSKPKRRPRTKAASNHPAKPRSAVPAKAEVPPAAPVASPAKVRSATPPNEPSGATGVKESILTRLASGELNVDEASRLLAAAEAPRRGLYCKVSQKGALSVYGLQRMPVTLYVQQWERLLEFGDEIRRFAKLYDDQLTRRNRAKK